MNEILQYGYPNKSYKTVVLFTMFYKVVLTFESVDEILKCDHSNEISSAVLSYDMVGFSIPCKH